MRAPDAAAGKKVKCPKCGAMIAVPAEEAAAGFEVVEDEPAPPTTKPAFGSEVSKPLPPTPAPAKAGEKPKRAVTSVADDEDVKPRTKAKAGAEDDEDDRPRKKARAEADDEDDEEKPRKKARAETDDDEDDRPRKRKRNDDDDRPRKKKKKRRDEDDEEGNGRLIRNIVGGVVLLVLVGVAIYIYYDKFGKKDEPTASSAESGDQPNGPPSGPKGPADGFPRPKGPGGNPPGRPFLDKTYTVPPRLEWNTDFNSTSGGTISFRVSGQAPFGVTVVTDAAYQALRKKNSKTISKSDVILIADAIDNIYEGKVTVPPGRSWFILENRTGKEVEFHLECFAQ